MTFSPKNLINNVLSRNSRKHTERKLNPIEELIQSKPDKIVLVLKEKEAIALKTACVLVKFSIVSRTNITRSKDSIDTLNRLIGQLDASIKNAKMNKQ